ncbi:hypothetical protein [Marinobacter salexigens]|uniref:hypothetical protein n=1 Tax=Marinobacter salexigens TaxID=1925763 RepID=UPI000C286514|nr:hypothetical protein [Marinobacter salexigens]
MLKVNRENLKASHQLIWLIIDLFMLGLIIVNLAFIVWDSVYSFIAIQNALKEHLPGLQAIYHPMHENFILYDAMFVAVFLSEFFVRWAYAIKASEYDRWYFYPFIHWYDLVGCIPVGSLRFLRILRVISILHRLHQHKIIDITDTGIYRFVNFYYEAFMEELSDRIVAKVLSGVQHEITLGSPLFDKVQNDILYPRRDMLSGWISQRVAQAAKEGYVPNRAALRSYLEDRVDHALKQNMELSRLKYLPIVGSTIQETLEDAVGDIVANVIQQILEDLASSANHAFIGDIVNAFIRGPELAGSVEERNEALIKLIVEIIEAIKGQVKVKRWREQLP